MVSKPASKSREKKVSFISVVPTPSRIIGARTNMLIARSTSRAVRLRSSDQKRIIFLIIGPFSLRKIVHHKATSISASHEREGVVQERAVLRQALSRTGAYPHACLCFLLQGPPRQAN